MPSPKFHSRSLTELIALREGESELRIDIVAIAEPRTDTQPVDPAVHTGAAEFGERLMTLRSVLPSPRTITTR